MSSTRTLSMATPGSARGFEPVATITCFASSSAGLRAVDPDVPAGVGAAPGERAPAVEERDLVLLEQIEDAVVVLRDDLFLARLHALDVDREALDLDAVVGEARGPRARSAPTTAAAPSTECSRRWCTCRPARACRRRASSRRCRRSETRAARSGSRRCSRPDRRRSPPRRIFQPSRARAANHRSSSMRAGSSSASLIATSDSTASRPSMIRWSYDCAR